MDFLVGSSTTSTSTETAKDTATGVKDSVFSMFGGGAKKEKKEEPDDEDEPSGSSKKKKDEEVRGPTYTLQAASPAITAVGKR